MGIEHPIKKRKLMKKQTIAIIAIAILIIAVVLLLFSTKIALLVSGFNMQKKNADSFVQNQELKYGVDEITSPEGMLKTVRVHGWAFNQAHQLDTEKHITLILKAKRSYYEVSTEMTSRPDVANHFSDLNLNADDLGYIGTFSIIALEDGDYELFVRVWEGKEELSFLSMNRFFNKTEGVFREIEPVSD